jgi:hypothetical protein
MRYLPKFLFPGRNALLIGQEIAEKFLKKSPSAPKGQRDLW